MWSLVRELKKSGVTIILTTHYIEEAEEMADRIGVISKGNLLVVDDKDSMMQKLGKRELLLEFEPGSVIPETIMGLNPDVTESSLTIHYEKETNMPELIKLIADSGFNYRNLQTRDSSLEDIFVELVKEK